MASKKLPTNIAEANAVVRKMRMGRSISLGEAKASLRIMADAYKNQQSIVRLKDRELQYANSLIDVLSRN